MSNEIESIKPTLSVILDDGDFIINSTGAVGRAMVQAILPLVSAAHRVTVITDGEMKVMKRNGKGSVPFAVFAPGVISPEIAERNRVNAVYDAAPSSDPDIEDQFVADLAAGRTGEAAMGEQPAPTPGPNDPVKVPAVTARRKPVIFQDAAAPPAPELAEAEMDRLLEEAAQAEAAAAQVAEDQRFQRQQTVQAGNDPAATVDPVEVAAASKSRTRTREPRSLATTGRPCGRCGGGGHIIGDAGFAGACPVCHGDGQVKTWDRSLKVR